MRVALNLEMTEDEVVALLTDFSCGLLAGRDRLHFLACKWFSGNELGAEPARKVRVVGLYIGLGCVLIGGS